MTKNVFFVLLVVMTMATAAYAGGRTNLETEVEVRINSDPLPSWFAVDSLANLTYVWGADYQTNVDPHANRPLVSFAMGPDFRFVRGLDLILDMAVGTGDIGNMAWGPRGVVDFDGGWFETGAVGEYWSSDNAPTERFTARPFFHVLLTEKKSLRLKVEGQYFKNNSSSTRQVYHDTAVIEMNRDELQQAAAEDREPNFKYVASGNALSYWTAGGGIEADIHMGKPGYVLGFSIGYQVGQVIGGGQILSWYEKGPKGWKSGDSSKVESPDPNVGIFELELRVMLQ